MSGFRLNQADYGKALLTWDGAPLDEAFLSLDELGCGSSDGAPHGYFSVSGDDDEGDGYAQLAGELGIDPMLLALVEGDHELGFSLKKLVKKVGKGIKKGIKAAAPILKVAGTVTAFVVPAVGLPMVAAAAGADKLITAAEKGSKVAKKAYKATKALAGKGNPDAKRALSVLARVQLERRKKAVPKGAPLPVLQKPAAQRQLVTAKAKLQAPVPSKARVAAHAGFVITKNARVRPVTQDPDGRFKAA